MTKGKLRRVSIFVLVFCLFLTLATVIGCQKDEPTNGDTGDIHIAFVGALTGPVAETGQYQHNGAELAVKNINATGGINGRNLVLVPFDDRCEPKEAANIANIIVNDDRGIVAIVGHQCSSATLAATPIYKKDDLLVVSPSSSSPVLSTDGLDTYRTVVTDELQGNYLVEWVESKGLEKVAVFYQNDDFGSALAKVIKDEATVRGLTIVAEEAYIANETKDFSPNLTKVQNLEAEAVIVAGNYAEAAIIAKQAHQSGYFPEFFGADSLYTSGLIELGAEDVEEFNVMGFFHSSSTEDITEAFVKEYRDTYSLEPDTMAAQGYDAVLAIAEALKNSDGTAASTKAWLASSDGFKGVTGNYTFDEKGDCIKNPIKIVVKNGKFEIAGE